MHQERAAPSLIKFIQKLFDEWGSNHEEDLEQGEINDKYIIHETLAPFQMRVHELQIC